MLISFVNVKKPRSKSLKKRPQSMLISFVNGKKPRSKVRWTQKRGQLKLRSRLKE